MFEVSVMRADGQRLPADQRAQQNTHVGDFVLDQAHGARRLRIKNPWSGGFAPIELYDPVLIGAGPGSMMWRGYERSGERGVVQEWMTRIRG